jgi:hypothetical protein
MGQTLKTSPTRIQNRIHFLFVRAKKSPKAKHECDWVVMSSVSVRQPIKLPFFTVRANKFA